MVAAGDLTVKQRNDLLASMTDEVAALVLADNADQTRALALAESEAPGMVDVHARLMADLEHGAASTATSRPCPTPTP